MGCSASKVEGYKLYRVTFDLQGKTWSMLEDEGLLMWATDPEAARDGAIDEFNDCYLEVADGVEAELCPHENNEEDCKVCTEDRRKEWAEKKRQAIEDKDEEE